MEPRGTFAAAFLIALTYTSPFVLASPVSFATAAEISSATEDVASAAAFTRQEISNMHIYCPMSASDDAHVIHANEHAKASVSIYHHNIDKLVGLHIDIVFCTEIRLSMQRST